LTASLLQARIAAGGAQQHVGVPTEKDIVALYVAVLTELRAQTNASP
jgi:hypothetical protein